jgi:integrase
MSSESENITEMDFEYVDPSKDDVLHDFKERNPEIDKHYGIKRRKYALSKEQREELLQIAFNKNPIHYCVIRTQLETGTRVGEMANLTLDRLHLDDKNPWIKIQKQETTKYYSSWSPKTISGDRDIYISSDLAQALKYCVKNMFLFPKRRIIFERNQFGILQINMLMIQRLLGATLELILCGEHLQVFRSKQGKI